MHLFFLNTTAIFTSEGEENWFIMQKTTKLYGGYFSVNENSFCGKLCF